MLAVAISVEIAIGISIGITIGITAEITVGITVGVTMRTGCLYSRGCGLVACRLAGLMALWSHCRNRSRLPFRNLGISADINQQKIILGNDAIMSKNKITLEKFDETEQLLAAGKTLVYVVKNNI